jgi:hypothetical protein
MYSTSKVKNILTVTLALVLTWAVQAQTEKPELITDRPDQTEAPELVPVGALQIETGFVMEKDRRIDVDHTNLAFHSTLIKYGVNENLELRFITEYLGQRVKVGETITSSVNGFSPIAVGVKLKIGEENGFWPQTGLLVHVSTRSGTDAFEPEYTAADFRFAFGHSLSDKLSLGYNVGAAWDGESPRATFLYTTALGYSVSKRLGLFVEVYSFFPEGDSADHRFDVGLTFKFSPVVQWDVSAGMGLSENAPDSFVSSGLSFRLFK